jgi:iron complex outermembrane receptor protein
VGNAKWTWQAGAATRIDTVVNILDQPLALDPLGLTRAQWEQNPRQAPAIAFTQDASKTVRQQQAGTVVSHAFDSATTLEARAYMGTRELDNKLSTPLANQIAPTSSGGIVSFDRAYWGGALQLSRRFDLGAGASARILGAVEYDRMRDDRQGYINNAGARGELRRDEDDLVYNTDAFLQATIDLGERWSAVAGVRASHVRFETVDRYVAPGNPDDSGSLDFRSTNPVGGLTWRASPDWNLYVNAGRGFETPTFTELAYRNNASGLNTALRPARSDHFELGTKWRAAAAHALEGALFDIRTRDEIVVDANVGGRSTFRNADGTTRRGVEAAYRAEWSGNFRTYASFTALKARFDNGNRLPGTPERSAFAEAVYGPRTGWHGALELVHQGRIYVNDANEDAAAAWTIVNLRAGTRVNLGMIELEPLIRLENATGRKYAGSVIVNEAQRRFFEPAPERSWMFSVTARYRF